MTFNRNKPTVIFYAPILEFPPAGGPQISVVNAIKVLGSISNLFVMTTISRDRLAKSALQEFLLMHCNQVISLPSSRFHSKSDTLELYFGRFRRIFSFLFAYIDCKAIRRMVEAKDPDVIWVDRVLEHSFSVFSSLSSNRKDRKLVADTEAIYSRFLLRELPLIRNPVKKAFVYWRGKRKQKQEFFITRHASVVTAVSEVDAEYFRNLEPKSEVMLFSNVIDVNDFSVERQSNSRKSETAVLIGSFGRQSSPMDRAATWLAEEVVPLVVRRVPSFQLKIIGRNSDLTQSHRVGQNIQVLGQVDSMVDHIMDATMSLVPLAYESGTRFKILESGAGCTPVVSTTLGAEGLEVVDGESILIADTAEEFADAMITLLKDPALASNLGVNLREVVDKNYSLTKQRQDAIAIFEQLEAR